MKGCIVLVAYNEQEQRLLDDYKRTKAKLIEIENALAAIQTPHPGKRLAKSIQTTWLSGCFWHTTAVNR
jgi:toxic protein SymE